MACASCASGAEEQTLALSRQPIHDHVAESYAEIAHHHEQQGRLHSCKASMKLSVAAFSTLHSLHR